MLQKILQKILPKKTFQKIKKEAQSWELICNDCGFKQTVWDRGGVRFKAASTGKSEYGFCPKCNRKKLFKLEKK